MAHVFGVPELGEVVELRKLLNPAVTSLRELREKALLPARERGCATPSLKAMRRGRLPAWRLPHVGQLGRLGVHREQLIEPMKRN